MKLCLYENIYVNCRVKNYLKEDHRSYEQLMQLQKESLSFFLQAFFSQVHKLRL